MIFVLAAIALGVLAYLFWRSRFTTLRRECRWRRRAAEGDWLCAYCGATLDSAGDPRVCLRDQQ